MDLFTRALQADPDEVIFQLHPSPVRRYLGVASLALVSAVALRLGLESEASDGGRMLLMLIGALGFYANYRFWKSTHDGLELTPTELRETGGRRVMAVADIRAIERELFGVIRPTNGFVIAHHGRYPSGFKPGLWWRIGGRVGIGGLTPSGEGKAMAELLLSLVDRQMADAGATPRKPQ